MREAVGLTTYNMGRYTLSQDVVLFFKFKQFVQAQVFETGFLKMGQTMFHVSKVFFQPMVFFFYTNQVDIAVEEFADGGKG